MPPLKVFRKDLTLWRGQECGGNTMWGFTCPHCRSMVQIPESLLGLPDGSNPMKWIGVCPHCGGALEIETHEL